MSLRGNQLFGHKGTNKRAKIQKLVFVFLLRARVPSRRSRKVRISEQNIKIIFYFFQRAQVLSWRSHKGTNKRAKYKTTFLFPRWLCLASSETFLQKEWLFRPAFGQKCQKIGQFSSKKAFFRFFLAIVLARVSNFAKQIGTKEFMPIHMRKNESVQPINREDKAKNSRNRGYVMKYPWIRDEISANI